jgi:hypothetical protein
MPPKKSRCYGIADQRPGDRCRRPGRSAPDSKPAPKPAAPPGAVAKEPHADRNRQEPDGAWYGLSSGTTLSSGKLPDDTMGDIFIKRSKMGKRMHVLWCLRVGPSGTRRTFTTVSVALESMIAAECQHEVGRPARADRPERKSTRDTNTPVAGPRTLANAEAVAIRDATGVCACSCLWVDVSSHANRLLAQPVCAHRSEAGATV